MSIKQKICSRKFEKKSCVLKVGPCGVCGEPVGLFLFSVQNVRGGFIVVVLMFLQCCDVFVEHILVIIAQ